jgi:hypothetical protein
VRVHQDTVALDTCGLLSHVTFSKHPALSPDSLPLRIPSRTTLRPAPTTAPAGASSPASHHPHPLVATALSEKPPSVRYKPSLRQFQGGGSSKDLSLRKHARHENSDGRAGRVGDGSVWLQRLFGGAIAASGDCDPHAGCGNLSLASGDQSWNRHAAEASLGADGRARWVRPRGRARPRKAHTTSDALRRVRTSKEGAHLQRSAANECCTHPRKREDAPRV